MTQKFFRGDLVRIADDLGPSKNHFEKGCEAVVMYTYAEQYDSGKRNEKMYSLFILPNGGESSWYDEEDLEFVIEDGWKKMPKNHILRRNEEARAERRNSLLKSV